MMGQFEWDWLTILTLGNVIAVTLIAALGLLVLFLTFKGIRNSLNNQEKTLKALLEQLKKANDLAENSRMESTGSIRSEIRQGLELLRNIETNMKSYGNLAINTRDLFAALEHFDNGMRTNLQVGEEFRQSLNQIKQGTQETRNGFGRTSEEGK